MGEETLSAEAECALNLVKRIDAAIAAEPEWFRENCGGNHRGWVKTARGERLRELTRRADQLYARAAGIKPRIGPVGRLP